MDELEALRQKRLLELQEQQSQQQELEVAKQQIEHMALNLLDAQARSRLTNIKISSPQKYFHIVQIIVTLAKQGHLPQKVSDEELKTLIGKLNEQTKKRETKIKRI